MAHLSHRDPKTAAICTKVIDRAQPTARAALPAEAAAKGWWPSVGKTVEHWVAQHPKK